MAFRDFQNPGAILGQGIANAGQTIAQIAQQFFARRAAEQMEAGRNAQAQARAEMDVVKQQLASPDIDTATRNALLARERQLSQILGVGPSEAARLFQQSQEIQVERPPTAQPGLRDVFAGFSPQQPTQIEAQAQAQIAAGEARRRASEVTLEQANQILSLATNPDLPQAQRRAFANLLLGIEIPGLPQATDALKGTANAIITGLDDTGLIPSEEIVRMPDVEFATTFGRFFDAQGNLLDSAPPSLRTAAEQADLGEKVRVGSAERARQNQISQIELQDAQLGISIKQLDLGAAGVAIQQAVADLDFTKLRMDEFARESFRATRRILNETALSNAQIDQIRAQIASNSAELAIKQDDESIKRITAAFTTGTDEFLNDEERAALAAMLGAEPGSQEYRRKLRIVAESNFNAALAENRRVVEEQQLASLRVDREQLALDADQYDAGRRRLLDARSDASTMRQEIASAVVSGDVVTLRAIEEQLKNPDAYPDANARAQAAGLDLQDVSDAVEAAKRSQTASEKARDLNVRLLELQTEEGAMNLAREFSSFFQTENEVSAFFQEHPGTERLLGPTAVQWLKGAVLLRAGDDGRAEAMEVVSALTARPPELNDLGIRAWRRQFVDQFVRTLRFGSATDKRLLAEQIADQYVNAWLIGADEQAMQLLKINSEIELNNARAADLAAKAAAGGVDTDLIRTQLTGFQRQETALEARRDTLNVIAVQQGCLTVTDIVGAASAATFGLGPGSAAGSAECNKITSDLNNIERMISNIVESIDLLMSTGITLTDPGLGAAPGTPTSPRGAVTPRESTSNETSGVDLGVSPSVSVRPRIQAPNTNESSGVDLGVSPSVRVIRPPGVREDGSVSESETVDSQGNVTFPVHGGGLDEMKFGQLIGQLIADFRILNSVVSDSLPQQQMEMAQRRYEQNLRALESHLIATERGVTSNNAAQVAQELIFRIMSGDQ